MTTTELIKLLRRIEFGGATGRPRKITLYIPGYGLFCDLDFSIDSTDDGLYTGVCFRVKPGSVEPDEEADSLLKLGNDYGLTPEGVRHAIEAYQEIICEITGGKLSKLTYDASFVLEEAEGHYEWKYGEEPKKREWNKLTEDADGVVHGLPGDDGTYLMTDGKDIWVDDYVDGVDDGVWLDSGRDIREIKAWMYMPELPD